MSEFQHPPLLDSKLDRSILKRRIFFACFASLLPLFPLTLPSPSDIHISTNPCVLPSRDIHNFTTGRNWIDRQACKWFGLACGPTVNLHYPYSPIDDLAPISDGSDGESCAIPATPNNYSEFWTSGRVQPDLWDDEERRIRTIPQYVLDYAPLIHLYSKEEFWPCDVASHLEHTMPYVNYTPIETPNRHWNMSELGWLGRYGWDTYLKSDDDVETRPDWLGGKSNIPGDNNGDGSPDDDDDDDEDDDRFHWDDDDETPDAWGYTEEEARREAELLADAERLDEEAYLQAELDEEAKQISSELKKRSMGGSPISLEQGGRSDAPVILISVDKGNGVVDAFWFFFYSYNLGNKVVNVRFGNHVGDWEHTVVRFVDGLPTLIFFSEHFFGEAYTYAAVEKKGKRPIGFSATGTHAMYGSAGVHRYILPWGLLHDITDRGPLWDPVLNSHSYTFDPTTRIIRSSTLDPYAPTSWLNFPGHWGDKAYPLTDHRQYKFAGQYHYVSGPMGPKFHRLNRDKICQDQGECKIRHWVGGTMHRWPRHGLGEREDEFGNRQNLLDEIQILMANRW